MKPSSEWRTHAWMDDRLEAYVDAELPGSERQVFEAALRADPAWQVEVERARHVRNGLRRLPQPVCPPQVTRAVMVEVERRARIERKQRWSDWIDRLRASVDGLARPVLAMTVLVVLVVAAARIGGPSGPPVVQQQYSQAEVERAAAQVRWTLGYVADVGETTGEAVQKEVLREHLTAPMQRAFDEVRL